MSEETERKPLRRTELRHKMLTLVGCGQIHWIPGWRAKPGRYDFKFGEGRAAGGEKTALKWLSDNRLISHGPAPLHTTPAFLTDTGKELLPEWNEVSS